MEKAFGIDLGTTYSCIAHIDEFKQPVVIKNMEGDSITPSVVYYESPTNVIVGKVAKDTAKLEPDKVVQAVKRNIGRSGFQYDLEGTDIRPEEISSLILKKLAQDAGILTGIEVKNVVITCPAYFGVSEREATKKAGELAELNVLSIIDEPVAAAIAYGYTKGTDGKVVLVYDLGGGTFDVTMIEITEEEGEKVINVIATGGDHNLGGKDWDSALIEYICTEFASETGSDDDEFYQDASFMQDISNRAEEAKKSLTQKQSVRFPVSFGEAKANIEITQEKFEEITESHLRRTIEYTKDVLKEAEKKGFTQFDELLLVGGSTRMPQVGKAIKQEFGDIKIAVFDPDEAVAKGAALFAEVVNYHIYHKEDLDDGDKDKQSGRLGGKGITIKPVSSKSYGTKAHDTSDNEEKIFNIIAKNTNVPTSETQRFGTLVDNQTEALIVVVENDKSDAKVPLEYGKEIGEATLHLPGGLPANSPIEITYTITQEGILEVRGLDLTGNRECYATIDIRDCISKEEFEEAKKRIELQHVE